MTCEACEEAREIDGDIPDCEKDGGDCKIPLLDSAGSRAFAIREKLVVLHDLVDAGTILETYGATRQDIELIAIIETELKKINDKDKDNG